MIKTILTSYTSYNIWANKKMMDTIALLPNDMQDMALQTSFPSLRKTVYHIWDAQVIWLSRLNGISLTTWPSETYGDNFEGYEIYFIKHCEEFDQFVKNKSEDYLESIIRYSSLNGKEFQSRAWQIIMHCMNHGTYHRGQLIIMLRNLGITELPQTDYIFYLREQ
ncbi:MAG: DNA polymerase [Fimbriimonadaceae bacterium]|nr:DNA polymerase [Chitinophagales bacterium]